MENSEEQLPKEGQSISIKEVLWLCVSKWYWFVIALAITCGYAYYYLAKTPKVYSATAAILVKDGAGASPDVSQAFDDMPLLKTNVNLNNEMVALKSPIIMAEVARKLGLDVNYIVKDKLSTRILYGTTLPASIKFLNLGDNGRAQVKMKYSSDGTLVLGPFAAAGEDIEEADNSANIEIKLADIASDTIDTPLGKLIVLPNEKFIAATVPSDVDILVDRIGYAAGASRLGGLKTEVRDNYSSVIHISLDDTNTERAVDELQAVIDCYNENWIKDRNQISVATSNFIDERLGVIESELGNVDSQISDYQAEHQLPSSGAASEAYFQRTLTAHDELGDLSVRISLARTIRDHLSNAAKNFQPLPSSSALGNGNVESQILAYNEELVQRNLMVQNSSEDNPLVQDRDYQLSLARQNILSAVDGYIASLNAEINATRSKLSSASSRLQSNPTQAKHLLDKERQQKVKESLYLYLLQKREENELSQAFTAYNTKIMMTPTVSGLVGPYSKKIMTMAIAIGLLVPGGLIFLLEMLNSKVRGRRDIEKLTIPFVGEIPQNGKPHSRTGKLLGKKKNTDRTADIVVKKGCNNVINEAFRVIRTNLEFMTPGVNEDTKVIMVTSANPGSGKTFISLNLATVLSLKGKRIALVDLDLRKGSLSAAVGAKNHGMSNYLAGNMSLDDIVVKQINGYENVDVYPAGPIPPNPAELLYSDKLKSMIEMLRKEYDYVIIDCPPAEVVADAKIINKMVDVTLFVIRAGLLERSMLGEVQRFYNENRYKNMAIILNGTLDPTASRMNRANRFGYGYGYYGYGYGYGYGQEHKKDN